MKKSIDKKQDKFIMVSGANGFTGRFVCKELKEKGNKFSVILRPGTDTSWMVSNDIPIYFADLTNADELSNVLNDCQCLINLVSIGFGAADPIIRACEIVKTKRVIFISSTSIFTYLNSNSKKTRLRAEESIKSSSLNWTIIRPTMIYGAPNDRNMIKLIKWIDNYPFLPVFGSGLSSQQPVNVIDLAWLIVKVLNNKDSYREIFNVSGEKPLNFNEVIEIISKGLNKSIIKIYLPYKFMAWVFLILERFKIYLPIKSEQILRLNENKVFSHKKAERLFGYKPMDFEQGILKEIEKYKNMIPNNKINL